MKDAFRHGAAARALAALVIVLLLGAIFNADGAFFKLGTHRDALRQASVYGILACGMTLVIISGGIDLAVGSVLALVAVFVSKMTIWWAWSPWISIPTALAAGAACGLASGLLVVYPRLQPFIATLAMMVFARGMAKTLSGGVKVATAVPQPDGSFEFVDVPSVFRGIDSRVLGDNLSVVTIILAACVAVSWWALANTVWGRNLYAVGGNEQAAYVSGISVVRTKLMAYIASGFFAAVAGICQAAQEQQGDPEAGVGYELTAIAIVVIGGTSLMGGQGSLALTVFGMLTIGYLEKMLSLNAVPEAMRLMLTGAIIVIAVMMQRRRQL
ncbi:MAG: ABC transporter permease [Methanoregulaceae archaeon]|nr:ABC transporter permease [Methanoregulaceae archaeon]